MVEGLPTIVLAPLAYFMIPDGADDARFLTEDEKATVRARTARQTGLKDVAKKIQWKDVYPPLLDYKIWLSGVSGCCPASGPLSIHHGG